jgi:hypothetical protein
VGLQRLEPPDSQLAQGAPTRAWVAAARVCLPACLSATQACLASRAASAAGVATQARPARPPGFGWRLGSASAQAKALTRPPGPARRPCTCAPAR